MIDALQVYLNIQILLVTSLLVFISGYWLANFFGKTPHHREIVKLGQFLILASIFLPIGFHSIPKDQTKDLGFESFRPISENTKSGLLKFKSLPKFDLSLLNLNLSSEKN
jgi:hypothetical protein